MKNKVKGIAAWAILLVVVLVLANSVFNSIDTTMSYSELLTKIEKNEIAAITIASDGTYALVSEVSDANGIQKEVKIPSIDSFMNYISTEVVSSGIEIKQNEESMLLAILEAVSPFGFILIVLLFWLMLMNPNKGNNQSMSFGKSKARMMNSATDKVKVTFADVAGVEEEKE